MQTVKKSKILIITNKDDIHADAVIARAKERQFDNETIRINTEDFNRNCLVSFKNFEFNVAIEDSNRSFCSEEVKTVWYRRPSSIIVSQSGDEGVDLFIKQQTEATMRGLFFVTHHTAKWVNPLPALHFARHKIPQLKIAQQVGFMVPDTLVTNSIEEVKSFFAKHEVVCNKSLDEPCFSLEGKLHTYLTRKYSSFSEIEDAADSIALCPTLFQEYIEKDKDIRVVVMGDKVTAVAIESQENSLSHTDFRGCSPHLLKHTLHLLPERIETLVRGFVKYYGLAFSSMDLVLDRNGNYYFIENNCNGQWLWLDYAAGTNLVDDMVTMLYES